MKKLIVCVVLAVVSANAGKLSEDELANLRGSCTELEDKSACQKLCKLGEKDACGEQTNVSKGANASSSSSELIGLIGRCTEMADEAVCEKLAKKGLPSVEQCNKESCRHIGYFYASVQHSYKNDKQAMKYFQKACKLGDSMGCDEQKKLEAQGVK